MSKVDITQLNKKSIPDNNLMMELFKKQLPTSEDKKLYLHDIKRICKNINNSIFGNECSLWNGYITNLNKFNKGTYINFYFKKKKVALHRLLYINYIGHLKDNEYIKFTCPNKGICCNINHLKKFKYNKPKENIEKEENYPKIIIPSKEIIIDFD